MKTHSLIKSWREKKFDAIVECFDLCFDRSERPPCSCVITVCGVYVSQLCLLSGISSTASRCQSWLLASRKRGGHGVNSEGPAAARVFERTRSRLEVQWDVALVRLVLLSPASLRNQPAPDLWHISPLRKQGREGEKEGEREGGRKERRWDADGFNWEATGEESCACFLVNGTVPSCTEAPRGPSSTSTETRSTCCSHPRHWPADPGTGDHSSAARMRYS